VATLDMFSMSSLDSGRENLLIYVSLFISSRCS